MATMRRLIRIEDALKVLTYATAAIGFLSVARVLPPAFNAGFIAFYIIAAVIEYRKERFIPRWMMTSIALVMIIVTFWRMSMNNFVVPSVEAISVLLLVKLIEEKKFRDYMQVYMLSAFLLAGAALLSLDLVFLLYFSILPLISTAALVLLAYYAQDRELELAAASVTAIISKSLLIPLAAVPMTILLFIVLPRTSYPIFNFLNSGGSVAVTGFTDQVRLGAISSIQEESTIVFRAGMDKIDDASLYWRGIVLDYFDGTSWKNSGKAQTGVYSLHGIAGKRVTQTIYLEPYENRYFFALDFPMNISLQQVQRQPDLTFSSPDKISRRVKYYAWSILARSLPEKGIDRAAYLQLPPKLAGQTGENGKVEELVHRLAVRNNPVATVRSILSFLKRGNYRYSLTDLPRTSHPLEDFLFRYRYGNCEYFASAMAVMLRMSGIPSRLVGGYRGGYYNEMGKYYMVPEKNAHVWVEAYIDNEGWIRVDPTPLDSSRFGSGLRKNLLFTLRLFFDSLNYAWNASVINYDLERQLSFLASVSSGIKKPRLRFGLDKKEAMKYLVPICGVSALIYASFVLMRRRKNSAELVIGLFLEKTGRLGFVKIKSEGLEEFVRRIEDAEVREKAFVFVKEFERYYYRDEEIGPDASKRLRYLIKAI